MELLSCALLTIADAPAAARPAVEAAIAATLRSAPPLALGAAFATAPDPRGSHSFAPSLGSPRVLAASDSVHPAFVRNAG